MESVDPKYLQGLVLKADKILREELKKEGLTYELAEVRIYDIKRVGVQGDKRTEGHPIELTFKQLRGKNGYLFYGGQNKNKFHPFLDRLSSRFNNEIEGVLGYVWSMAHRNLDGVIWSLHGELLAERILLEHYG